MLLFTVSNVNYCVLEHQNYTYNLSSVQKIN